VSSVLHQRRKSFWARLIVETAVAFVGIALLSCAVIANQRFLDRHFVPSFFLPHDWYVVLQTSGRLAMAILGTWLALVARRRAGCFAARTPEGALRSVMAVRVYRSGPDTRASAVGSSTTPSIPQDIASAVLTSQSILSDRRSCLPVSLSCLVRDSPTKRAYRHKSVP